MRGRADPRNAMQLYHPIILPVLAEAWVLDRLAVEPTGDRDRPSLRFFRDRDMAAMTAQAMQHAWDRRAGGARPRGMPARGPSWPSTAPPSPPPPR